jgi:hypothetical protein
MDPMMLAESYAMPATKNSARTRRNEMTIQEAVCSQCEETFMNLVNDVCPSASTIHVRDTEFGTLCNNCYNICQTRDLLYTQIKDFSLRAAGRLFHLTTGKEATCKIDEINCVVRKAFFGESLYTFEVWVDSGDLDCCLEGTWCGETHSPTDFTTRIAPQE